MVWNNSGNKIIGRPRALDTGKISKPVILAVLAESIVRLTGGSDPVTEVHNVVRCPIRKSLMQ